MRLPSGVRNIRPPALSSAKSVARAPIGAHPYRIAVCVWFEMIAPRIAALFGALLLLAACDPARQQRLRTVGPGLELADPGMEARTRALGLYFDQLCRQAGVVAPAAPPGACPTGSLNAPQWRRVVDAGYNDIDRRCDEYLAWIDEQRTRLLLVNEGITALSGLLGGVLGLAAPQTLAINYATLALGFTGSLYNAYQNLALLGIESSTIKTIVIERRLEFRGQFRDAPYASKPDAVYALRSYLRLCTPQEITLDINTYSRDVVSGRAPEPERRLRMMREAIGPVAAETPADRASARRAAAAPPGFRAPTGGYGPEELRTIQRALCLEPDGVFGPRTRAGVELFESARAGTDPDAAARALMNGEIDDVEFDVLADAVCDAGRYENYFESDTFADNPELRAGFADLLNERLAVPEAGAPALPPLPLDVDFGDAAFRERVAEARRRLGVDEGALVRDQITPKLFDRLTE